MTQQRRIDPPQNYPAHWLTEIEPIAPFDFWGLLRVVWSGKWIILLATTLTLTIAGYYAFRIAQPRFEARATVALNPTNGGFNTVGAQPNSTATDDMRLNTQVATLTSNHLLGQVITELDLLSDPAFNRYLNPVSPYAISTLRRTLRNALAGTTDAPPTTTAILEKTIENLRNTLQTRRQTDTYILQITARSSDAAKAALIANTTAELYLADQHRTQAQAGLSTQAWLNDRVADLKQRLEAKELQISGLIASAQLQEDAGLDILSNQVLSADQQLAQAQADLSTLTATRDVTTPRTTAEVAQKQAAIAQITAQRERLSTQLSVQSSGLAQLHQMRREADATRVLYESYLARLQETRVEQGLVFPTGERITVATKGDYIGPQKILILTVAVMVGGVLGLAIIGLQYSLRKGVVEATELRDATGIPVWAQFPKTAIGTARKLRKLLSSDRQTALSQAVTGLRTSLLLATHGHAPQVVLSTSSVPGEGKTTHALALADALGRSGKSVLLVGADRTGSTLMSFLTTRPLRSMQDIMIDDVSVAQAVSCDENLAADLLLAFKHGDVADIFLSDGFDTLLNMLRDDYDHIIIDGPPVITAPETRLWAQKADAVVYAVCWMKTPLATVKHGLRALDEAGAPATGLVLSRVNQRKLRRLGQGPFLQTQGASLPA